MPHDHSAKAGHLPHPEGCCHETREHSHVHDASSQQLAIVLGLVAVYFLAELAGGWWTGSLALLADAVHMFSDMAALGVSLGAAWIARRGASAQRTFGYRRAEILAALANGATLLLVAGGIVHEAWDRFLAPQPILSGPMLWIAIGGLAVNLLSLRVLHGDHHHDLNLRGAWLHVLGDALGSVGVIAAAFLIWAFGWWWADPAASVAVCVLILFSAGGLVLEAVHVLMEHAPRDVDVEELRRLLMSLEGVRDVHCLHVWTIASGLRALSAHLVVDPDQAASLPPSMIRARLCERFPLEHVTLQIETEPCEDCPLVPRTFSPHS